MRSPCWGAALDPPLWTVVPNKAALSLSLSPTRPLIMVTLGFRVPGRGPAVTVTVGVSGLVSSHNVDQLGFLAGLSFPAVCVGNRLFISKRGSS
jgi:hypothetical protein